MTRKTEEDLSDKGRTLVGGAKEHQELKKFLAERIL
jgi:hypothetical protein